MAFSLLSFRNTGRSWSRGDPPPRGSVEYCGVPELFQPPARSSSSGQTPRAPSPPPARPAPPAPSPPPPRAATPPAAAAAPPRTVLSVPRPSLLPVLGAAGAAYLLSRLLSPRDNLPETLDVDEEDESPSRVVVLEPGDVVISGGDSPAGEEYDDPALSEEDDHAT